MAFSLLAAALAAGTAAAQTDERPVAPSIYNARIAPWPSAKLATPSPQPQPAQLPQPVPLPQPAPGNKTLYYKKEANSEVRPAAMIVRAPRQDAKEARDDKQPAQGGRKTSQQPTLSLDTPPPETLFRLDSEARMEVRIQEVTNKQFKLPAQDPVSNTVYAGRSYAQMVVQVEPNFVCYGRLYYEQRNCERYGWTLGPIQPVVSSAKFVWDSVTLPYKLFSFPCQRYECSAGLCLPGDSVPFLLYPPGLSATGALGEAGVIVALFAIIP